MRSWRINDMKNMIEIQRFTRSMDEYGNEYVIAMPDNTLCVRSV
jgi:hypothetical protein